MEREGVAVVFCNSVLLIPGHGAGPCCARHAATISVSLSTSLHRKEEICNIWSSGIFPWLPLAIGISADWAIQKVLGNKSQLYLVGHFQHHLEDFILTDLQAWLILVLWVFLRWAQRNSKISHWWAWRRTHVVAVFNGSERSGKSLCVVVGFKENFLNVESLNPWVIFVAKRWRVRERDLFVACGTYPV